jgi:peptidoglycan/xylan/chitin deacetylase (PgdA/CDA1 family)
VQFDVAAGDGFQPHAGAIVRTVVNGARNGSIVVLHMNGANTSPRTAQAIGPIVEHLRGQGYSLTTVSGLLAPGG